MRTNPIALVCGLLLAQISCGGPDINTSRTPSEGGIDFDFDGGGAADDDAGGGGCTGGIPKVGENCGPGVDESTSCTFTSGECTANGMTYEETVTFCCPQGVWEECNATSPCDNLPDAAEPQLPLDGGVGDAVGDGPDGGNDTGPADAASAQ